MINVEVAVEGQNLIQPFALGNAHERCVREVHLPIAIFLHQLLDTREIRPVEVEELNDAVGEDVT